MNEPTNRGTRSWRKRSKAEVRLGARLGSGFLRAGDSLRDGVGFLRTGLGSLRARFSVKARTERRFWVPGAALLLAIASVAVFLPSARPRAAKSGRDVSLEQLASSVANSARSARLRPARLVYQYSVIPGGVQDVAELSNAVAHDPDVAFHYAAMNLRRAHVVLLPADERQYISYRRHGRILWSKTPHLIRAGEKVITDGKVTARARCGNRLASKPEGLTAPDEPTESQLNQPVAMAGDPARPPDLLAQNSPHLAPQPLVANGPPPAGPIGVPLLIGPIIGGGGGSSCETPEQEALEHDHDKGENICPPTHHHHKPPPSVPEPSTEWLMGTGVLLLGTYCAAKRRYAAVRAR